LEEKSSPQNFLLLREKTNIQSFKDLTKTFPLSEISQERNTPPQDKVPKKIVTFDVFKLHSIR